MAARLGMTTIFPCIHRDSPFARCESECREFFAARGVLSVFSERIVLAEPVLLDDKHGGA
jgi:hypothetical protein